MEPKQFISLKKSALRALGAITESKYKLIFPDNFVLFLS